MAHIALITTSYPDGNPGADAAGSFVEDFALELAKLTRVTVLAASTGDSIETAGNLSVRRFAVPRLPLSLLKPCNPLDWSATIGTLRAGRRALSAMLDDDPPDHILALWALPCGWWAESAAARRNIPFSVWALGSDIWSLGRIPLLRKKLKNILRAAQYRYADGLALCSDVKGICGRPCTFLPSSRNIPTRRGMPAASVPPYKLAFLGRWHPNKGIDLLMQALLALTAQDWDKIEEIRIYGGGPLAAAVHTGSETLTASGRPVTVGGFLDKTEAAALIGWADYLLLPSRIESIPVIFSDAMQQATPIIAMPVGDMPRLHQQYEFGILANAVSAEGFRGALHQAMNQGATNFSAGIESARRDFDPAVAAASFLKDVGVIGP